VEIDRLSNKVVQLKAERDIPKKAAAYFTKEMNTFWASMNFGVFMPYTPLRQERCSGKL
jgi:hypothetical protein